MLLNLNELDIVDDEERDRANTPTLPDRQPRMLSSSSESSDDDGEDSSSSGGFDWSMYIDLISRTPERASSPISAGEAGASMPVVEAGVEGSPALSVSNLQPAGEAADNPEVNVFDVLSYFNGLSSILIRDSISRGEFSWICFQINHRILEILGDPAVVPMLDSSEESSSEDSSSEESSFEEISLGETSSEESSSEESSSEESSLEETSSEESSSEESSLEETSFADSSFEDSSFKDSSFEETSFEDTAFEDTSFEETSEEETLLKEISLEETNPGQD